MRLFGREITLARGDTALTPETVAPARQSTSVAVANTYTDPSIPSTNIRADPTKTVGATGTIFFAGLISGEEYNPDLRGDALLRTTDRMWRSDPQVSALMQVLMLPLLEATWSVKAASDDPLDVEVAQFCQDNIFGGMQRTWHETMQFILLEWLRDGFAVLEKVYAKIDPIDHKQRLRKLAPRLSKSIYRWYPNDDDELDRIQQRVYRVGQDGMAGSYEFPVLEAPRLLVFTHLQEGNNFAGVSVLRSAYKPWFMKDQLERLACVAAERLAAGVPVMSEPVGPVQKSDRDYAMAVLTSLTAHEKQGVLEPNGYAFRFESGTGMDLIPLIEYMSLQIVRSVLAQFLNLDRGGSYALSLDVSSFFLQALHAKARYLRDVWNDQVIRPLVDLNFTVERYPTMEVEDLDKRQVDKYLPGLAAVLATGFVGDDVEAKNVIRRLLDMPDLPTEATPAGGNAPSVDTDSAGQNADDQPAAAGGTAPVPAPQRQAAATAPVPPVADEAQYAMPAWIQDTVAELLSEKPVGLADRAWREIVFSQSAEMAREAVTA